MAVEIERYGCDLNYPADVLREGRRGSCNTRPRQSRPRSPTHEHWGWPCGFQDGSSPTPAGSPLENHEEEGVRDDPHYGEHQTLYLLAMAVDPVGGKRNGGGSAPAGIGAWAAGQGYSASRRSSRSRRETGPAGCAPPRCCGRLTITCAADSVSLYLQASIGDTQDLPT